MSAGSAWSNCRSLQASLCTLKWAREYDSPVRCPKTLQFFLDTCPLRAESTPFYLPLSSPSSGRRRCSHVPYTGPFDRQSQVPRYLTQSENPEARHCCLSGNECLSFPKNGPTTLFLGRCDVRLGHPIQSIWSDICEVTSANFASPVFRPFGKVTGAGWPQ